MYFTKTIDSRKRFLYNLSTIKKGGPHMKKIIILFFLICAIPPLRLLQGAGTGFCPHGAAAHLAIGAFRG